MESNRSIWWKGALKGAAKGVVLGVMTGLCAYALLVGGLYALQALGAGSIVSAVVPSLGGFLFDAGTIPPKSVALPPFELAKLNPLSLLMFNSALSAVAGFFTGGGAAVAQHKQASDQARNEQRIRQLEGRGQLLEQVVDDLHPNTKWLDVLEKGPRHKESFVAAEEARAASATPARVLH